MAAHDRWFASVDLEGASPSLPAVLDELIRMLDRVQPGDIAPERSWVGSGRSEWAVESAVVVHLGHRSDESLDIEVVVGHDEAIVAWLSAHEHVYSDDWTLDRPWTTVVVDVVASVLRGEFLIEDRYHGDELVRTRIIDIVDGGEQVISESGTLLGGVKTRLFPRRGTRLERRRVDYGAADRAD